MRLSLPATASRLMSAIGASLTAGLPHSSLPLHALCRMESGVAPVCFCRRPVGRHPCRPAELPEMAETYGLNGARWNGQLGVPIELGSVVEIHEIRERLAQVSAGQKSNILSEAAGVDADPDLVLYAINAPTEHRVLPKYVVALAQDRIFLGIEHQPRSDELIDFRFHLKQAAERAGEARGGFRLAPQHPGKAELGGIRNAVEISVRFGAGAYCRADVGEKPVCCRTIVLGDRARIRPCAEKKLEKAMIENV